MAIIQQRLPLDFNSPEGSTAKNGFIPASELPIDSFFPEESANTLASTEAFNKHLYRPNTYLHKWWARRSGTTFRHILKQLIADPQKRRYLSPGGLEGAVILDPMMGGGTTIHEAIRLNANCIGIDVDPIPVLQIKATLQKTPLYEKKKTFLNFHGELSTRIGHFFNTRCPICDEISQIQFTLYALRRKCNCHEVAVLDSYVLREEKSHSVRICPNCGEITNNVLHKCAAATENSENLIERSETKCSICGETYKDILDVPFNERYLPVVITGHCKKHGQFYKTFNAFDQAVINDANAQVEDLKLFNPSDFSIPNGQKSNDLLNRNVHAYLDLFTKRQLLYLAESKKLLKDIKEENRIWMALLISTSLEFNSLLCGYKGAGIRRPGAIRHVFSHHAYSFPYTALENNPVSQHSSSGTLLRLFGDRIEKSSKWAESPVEKCVINGKATDVIVSGETDSATLVDSVEYLKNGIQRAYVFQGDSRSVMLKPESVDYVVTDPPYYDSVQYSDLSTFFRVWLQQFLPEEANWRYDSHSSAIAEDKSKGKTYGDSLTSIWQNCYTALKKPQGRLIFTFHHWRPDAWAELTISLKRSRFVLNNRYVIFSENPISVHIHGQNAITHDCILVLQPIVDCSQGNIKRWSLPEKLDLTDSHAFCEGCGRVLGFILETAMTENEIRNLWGGLIKE